MKFSATETAVLIVDMQVALLEPPPAELEEVIARTNALTARARAAGVPVVWVHHERAGSEIEAGSPGWQLHRDLSVDDADLRLHKRMSDAFLHSNLHDQLASRGVRQLVVCGYSSEFCIDSTVRAAASRGYAVTLAADAHTSHDKPHATGLQIRVHENETLSNISSYYVEIAAVPAAQIAFG